MNMNVKLLIYLIFLILISCSKNNDAERTKSNYLKIDDSLSVKISFVENEFIKSMAVLYEDSALKQNVVCELNQKDWQSVLSFIWNYTRDTSNIWSLTLYLDKYLNDIDSVEYRDIAAFQTYTVKPDKKLYHNFFVFQNDTFVELEKFHCETYGIRQKVTDYFMNKEINYKNASPQRNSRISLFSDLMHSYIPHKYKHDYLMGRIEKYGKK